MNDSHLSWTRISQLRHPFVWAACLVAGLMGIPVCFLALSLLLHEPGNMLEDLLLLAVGVSLTTLIALAYLNPEESPSPQDDSAESS